MAMSWFRGNIMVDYPGAIDRIITSPDWVFTDALTFVPAPDLTIVLHKTATPGATAMDVANYFANDTTSHKSAHFIVGRDGSVIQVVLLKDGAGANCCLEPGHDIYWDRLYQKYGGNLNRCTISIEHEDQTTNNSETMTAVQLDASFRLVKWLVERFHLTPGQIKGHNTLDPLSRARCPGPTYPLDALMKLLTVNNFRAQAARDTWFSTGIQARYDSGIANAWKTEYMTGVNMPPPSSKEFPTVDDQGNPIVSQFFGTLRCNWYNGTAHWIACFTGY